ncbi:Kelch-like ECH-associated protein 1 [Holothuria leucospilota]|uniref:Kelch-like ECH-associated protein 1 n=1 Tax=Holothuria leucospilota TaxID=206669 RepID=A0A9Q1C7P5_HOLLE|nr:Kelch-like ECH-associated protein 1 [Holothuria leucospilota]
MKFQKSIQYEIQKHDRDNYTSNPSSIMEGCLYYSYFARRTLTHIAKMACPEIPLPCTRQKVDDKCEFECSELGGCVTYKSLKHPCSAFEVLSELRDSRELCDITLVVDTVKFYAHRAVLVSCSPYFKAMLTKGFKECKKDKIELKDVHPCIFSAIIEFMYTSKISISESNVMQLLPKAMMYQVSDIVEACCEFLERQLDPQNCLGYSIYAKEHGLVRLHQKACHFIFTNFCAVSHSEEFLNLPLPQLIRVLHQDKLNVWSECEVYDACKRWVKHDEKSRKQDFEKLLGDGAIRAEHLTPCFLKRQLDKCELLRSDHKCKDYLSKIFQQLKLHKPGKVPPRHPSTARVIYTAGGYLRQSLKTFECYDPMADMWHTLPCLPEARSGLGAATIHGKFYCVGGRNNTAEANTDSNQLDCYCPLKNTWRTLSPMIASRNRVGVAVLDDMLYAVGGSQGCYLHNSAERYNVDENKWTMVANMNSKRIGVGCTVVNRLLYAVGGFDGQIRLRSVECYHPENNEWLEVRPMKTQRSGAGVASIGNYIFAVGGYDGKNQLNSVERYDIENDVWEDLPPMHSRRSALSVDVIGGKLYALGGYDGEDFLPTVECYDPKEGTWTIITNMSSGRSGAGVAVGMEPCKTSMCSGMVMELN